MTSAQSERDQSVVPSTTKPRQKRDLAFLGAPPLMPGEDVAAYKTLLALVSDTVKPTDIFDTIWVSDIVNEQLDIDRWRRVKANLIAGEIEWPNPVLEERTLTDVQKIAFAYKINLSNIEQIDRMIASMELRRNNALREIERHRTGFGALLRRAVEQVEDAEFREIDGTPAAEKRAA
jgi:hypothetical protein